MNILDAYYKKTIDFKFQDKKLKFKVSQSLFSSHIVDLGTQRLLRTFLSADGKFNKILDIGCGYGAVGITLKAINPNSEVHMVDRDALALEHSRINVDLNNLSGFKIYGSLGLDNIEGEDFDLIISNIPAKVGQKVLWQMLIGTKSFLSKDGFAAIVVVDAILDKVKKILSDPSIKVILEKSWNGHSVFHYKFIQTNLSYGDKKLQTFETGLYDRDKSAFNILGKEVVLETTFNLPEFNEISFGTQLFLDNITEFKNSYFKNYLVFNTNQGHIPVALSLVAKVDQIEIVDRNLQTIKTTEKNLILNGFSKGKVKSSHQVGLNIDHKNIDCVVGRLDKKESRAVSALLVEQLMGILTDDGRACLVSTSTIITQAEAVIKKSKKFDISKRLRDKGESILYFEKKLFEKF